MSRYILFLAKVNREERLLRSVQEGVCIVKLPLRVYTWLSEKKKKGCPFLKFEIILPLLCRLSDSLTNKHYRVCISMINLGIDSRTCQKCRILMSARLGDCKRKGFWECDAVILTMCYLIILHDMVSQNP